MERSEKETHIEMHIGSEHGVAGCKKACVWTEEIAKQDLHPEKASY